MIMPLQPPKDETRCTYPDCAVHSSCVGKCETADQPVPDQASVRAREDLPPSTTRLEDEAYRVIKEWGWTPGTRLYFAQIRGLMVRFAKKALTGELSCGWPSCGCCDDAACDEAQAEMKRQAEITEAEKRGDAAGYARRVAEETKVITYDEAVRRKVENRVAPALMGQMLKISKLIAWAQNIHDQWGDTCIYACELSWGAVALNRESDDRKRLLPEGSTWVDEPDFEGSPQPGTQAETIAELRLSEMHARADAEAAKAKVAALREALLAADQFITNGVEFKFIRMPDEDTNDLALKTPGIIRSALAATGDE